MWKGYLFKLKVYGKGAFSVKMAYTGKVIGLEPPPKFVTPFHQFCHSLSWAFACWWQASFSVNFSRFHFNIIYHAYEAFSGSLSGGGSRGRVQGVRTLPPEIKPSLRLRFWNLFTSPVIYATLGGATPQSKTPGSTLAFVVSRRNINASHQPCNANEKSWAWKKGLPQLS